jgi:hypothetical protein
MAFKKDDRGQDIYQQLNQILVNPVTGRRYLGIELEEKYCRVEKRLAGAVRFLREPPREKGF